MAAAPKYQLGTPIWLLIKACLSHRRWIQSHRQIRVTGVAESTLPALSRNALRNYLIWCHRFINVPLDTIAGFMHFTWQHFGLQLYVSSEFTCRIWNELPAGVLPEHNDVSRLGRVLWGTVRLSTAVAVLPTYHSTLNRVHPFHLKLLWSSAIISLTYVQNLEWATCCCISCSRNLS